MKMTSKIKVTSNIRMTLNIKTNSNMRKEGGGGYKGLQSLLGCRFFKKCSNFLIFWYCGRNVCFFKIPKFQDPTSFLPNSVLLLR